VIRKLDEAFVCLESLTDQNPSVGTVCRLLHQQVCQHVAASCCEQPAPTEEDQQHVC
jgi:hypothetical protein